MKTKFIVTALIVAVAAFGLTRIIWPDLPGMAAPSSVQLPLFVLLSIFECLAFGVGVAFIIFGWSRMKGVLPEERSLTRYNAALATSSC